MTIEEIKNEINQIILELKESIKEEESNSAKTSNYAIYKKTLSEAESLLKELNNPFVENNSASYFELKLQELQNPIY